MSATPETPDTRSERRVVIPPQGGRLHPFPKGVSGNPGGSPKRKPFADACREIGAMSPREIAALDPMDVETGEQAEALRAHKELLTSRRMPVKLLREIKDRSEGPVLRAGDEDGAGALRDPHGHAVLVVNIFARMGAEQSDLKAVASIVRRAVNGA